MKTLLFFDDWRIQNRDGMVRLMGQPRWIPEATLEDDLTEGTFNFPNAWRDKSGKWHAVYLGAAPASPEPGVITKASERTQILLYACSNDGIHWEKPDLTKQTHEISRFRKNQVFSGNIEIDPITRGGHRCDGGPVFYDEQEPNPERRLKYLYCHTDQGYGGNAKLMMATSPDGIHWNVEAKILGEGLVDSPIGLFYNKHRQSYIINRRYYNTDRRVFFIETKDFTTFGSPQLIMHPDPEDEELVQFYGMPVHSYDDMYIGLLWQLHADSQEIGMVKIFGPIDCALTYSYDGWNFNRAFHKTFIPRNERGEHGGGCVYVSSMVTTEKEIRFYSGGSLAEHFRNQTLNDAGLMMHTLRKDGFVYLESYSTRGRVITKGLCFNKDDLRLNVLVPYGSVRVQVRDKLGIPIQGLAYDDCVPFKGDAIEYKPQWKQRKTLKDVLGQLIYLDIEITEGKIYSIRGEFQYV